MSTPASKRAGKKARPAAAAATTTPPSAQSSGKAAARQATPFDAAKQQPQVRRGRSAAAAAAKFQPLPEEAEEEDEDEVSEESEEDGNEDASMSDASEAESPSGVAASLAAQFDAADDDDEEEEESGDEGSDAAPQPASDDSMEDEEDESESDEDDAPAAKQARKKLKGSDGAAAAAAPPAAPRAPKVLQIVAASDDELQYHLKQLHRIMKKLRAFAVKKTVRKIKDSKALGAPADVLAQLDSDLELIKHASLDHMALYGWRIYNQNMSGKKMAWDAETTPLTLAAVNATPPAGGSTGPTAAPRLRELLSQVLYSPACKKACQDYISMHLKKQKKNSARSRKLDKIAETAAKRKEMEKKKRDKAEAKAKAEAAKAGADDKEGSGDDSCSDKEEGTDNKPSEKKEQKEKKKKDKKKAASDASGDESDNEEKDRASKRAEKLARREKQQQKKKEAAAAAAALADVDAADEAADARRMAKAKRAAQNQGTDSSSGSSSSSDSSSDSDSDSDSKKKKKKTPSVLKAKPSRLFGGLAVGKVVDGVVSGVESFGLFIEFWYKKKERKGLCHISMLSDEYVADIATQYARGDAVQAVVTRIDEKTGRISLGLKASLFPEGKKPKPIKHLSKTAVMPALAEGKSAAGGAGGAGSGGQDNARLESMFMDSLHERKSGADVDPRLHNIKKFLSQVSSSGSARSQTVGANKNRLGQRERRKLISAVLGAEAKAKPVDDKSKHVQGWKRKQMEREAEKRGLAPPTFEAHEAAAKHGAAAAATAAPSSSIAGENRKAKRLRMHAEAIAAGQQVNPLAVAHVNAVTSGAPRPPKPQKPAAAPAAAAAAPKPHAPPAAKPSKPSKPAAPSRPASRPSSTPAAAPAAAAAAPTAEMLHPSWQAKQLLAAKAAAGPQGKKITFD